MAWAPGRWREGAALYRRLANEIPDSLLAVLAKAMR
jgi:hypothetical protein